MIYLAGPYSHPDPLVRQSRYNAACRATARLVRAGRPVFAPVVQGHALVPYGVPGHWLFWEPVACEYLRRCDELRVLQLDGWRESEGVRAELELAAELGKRVDYLET